MARPIKNNAVYFSHDANMRNDRKIRAIRNKFGLTGYAIWCMILEVLTDEREFVLHIDELTLDLLAADFGLQTEQLSEIIEYCVKLELLTRDGDKIFSQNHQKRFSALLSKRERDRNRVIASENTAKTAVNATENIHSIEENSKVKKKINRKTFISPCLNEFEAYFVENGFSSELAKRAFKAYEENDWHDSKNSPVLNWKSKCQNVWFKPENRAKELNTNLGIGERIDGNRRTYGDGNITIPVGAPPRPSSQHYWNNERKNWGVI